MQQKLIHEADGARTWAVVLQTGDEAVACLLGFAREHGLAAAQLTAIGAFERAVLGYFDWQRKDYRRNPVDGQVEVVALLGDIALKGDGRQQEPALHVHAVLGREDGAALGGHLLEGHVRPTLEVVVTESPAHLHRRHDAETGLALIRFDRQAP